MEGGIKIFPNFDVDFFEVDDIATTIELSLYKEYHWLTRVVGEKPDKKDLCAFSRGWVDIWNNDDFRKDCPKELA